MNGEIVAAKKSDVKLILNLLNSDKNLYATEEDKARIEDVRQYLNGGTHEVYLYKIDGKIAGLIIFQLFKIAKWIYLNYIVVHRDYQRKGIAKYLTSFLEKKAKKENYYLIELVSKKYNKNMKKFMKKLNYSEGDRLRFYYKRIK